MAKEMVYFNATKQIETLTIHYNSKLDGAFVEDVSKYIKEVAKKMSKVDLKNPKEFDSIQVFVYPSKKLFYKVFAGEIEKRFYSRRRSLEDLYVVRDSEGNIHIVSPRGMSPDKIEAFKKILVMKVIGEYMDEKQKLSAERLLKEAMKSKEIEEEELPEEEPEQEEIDDEELSEEELEQEEIDEAEVDELIETEQELEQIDEEQSQDEDLEEISEESEEVDNATKSEQEKAEQNNKVVTKSEAQEWLSIGWMAYVKGKLRKEKDIKRFADNISKNGVKKLGKLSNSKWYENYNYAEEYACAIVEYVITTYGMKKFIEYYKDPKDIRGVFGVSKFVFDNQVKAYIYSRYTDKEMKMEMDQRKVNEITEIHFSKTGGADITTDKEIEPPTYLEIKEKI